jgi:hypothetical protein
MLLSGCLLLSEWSSIIPLRKAGWRSRVRSPAAPHRAAYGRSRGSLPVPPLTLLRSLSSLLSFIRPRSEALEEAVVRAAGLLPVHVR